MTKQAELVIKIMSSGVPDEVQDVIGDKLEEYKGTGRSEDVAAQIINIIEGPGSMDSIIGAIKSIK